MVNSVSVHNFKILENLENVPLGRITLIGGKNNSGKTTLLEALFLYFDCYSHDVINRLFAWRRFSGSWSYKEVWKKFFFNSDFKNEINITVSSNKFEKGQLDIKYLKDYETSVQFPVTENGITTLVKNFSALSIKHTLDEFPDYLAYLLVQGNNYNYLKEFDSTKPRYSMFYMGEDMKLYEKNNEYLGILDKADEQEKILPLLRLFESNLMRLQLIDDNGNNVIYADFGNKKKIPVNMLGDGFCRCLTMALLLATKNADIFLVDEVASGIHYSIQDELWKFLIKATEVYDCQIVATTHSYETIKSFNNAIKDNNISNINYIRLGKTNNNIKAHIFEQEMLDHAFSTKLEVR